MLIIGEDSELGLRRLDRGTPADRIVVHRAPKMFAMSETLAKVVLSGQAFGVMLFPGRVIVFGTPGEGCGRVGYEVKSAWRGQCLCKKIDLP